MRLLWARAVNGLLSLAVVALCDQCVGNAVLVLCQAVATVNSNKCIVFENQVAWTIS